jgi:hypothetical protein
MRPCSLLIILATLAIPTAASAASGHDPPPPPAGYDGWLLLYIIPPPGPIDWTTPSDLTASFIVNRDQAAANVKAGRAFVGHPIGHVHVEMECKKDKETETIPLTGMTSDEESLGQAGDGLGTLLRDYKGRLDQMKGKDGQGGKTRMLNDLSNRKSATGYLGIMRFPITWAECAHLRAYYDDFNRQGAFNHYGSQFRPRGYVKASGFHEGGGCATFGVSFLDVAGILPRPTMTKKWARQQLIGTSLIADVGGGGSYPYGSNLIATVGATIYTWPVNKGIRAGKAPINSLKDRPWYTPAELAALTVVPLTLYDPELMYNDLSSLYVNAKAGSNNGWKASLDVKARVIELDRGVCPPKPNLKPLIDKVLDLNDD